MEVPEVTVGVRDIGGVRVSSSSDGVKVPVDGVMMESENLSDDLLQDLDPYLDDINVRLTISRMVGDSVMKGVVKAVEQVAAEKIAVKELEVVKLKDVLRSCQVGDDKSESSGSLVVYHEPRSEENGSYEVRSKREIEDFDIEFLIKEGLCAVIFREAAKDARSQISDLSTDYLNENDNRVSLELKVLEKTKELDLIKGELSDAVKQIEVDKVEIKNLKDHVGSQEAMSAMGSEELDLVKRQLADVMEQIEVGKVEINSLKDHNSRQDLLLIERRNDLDLLKSELVGALVETEIDKVEMNILNQKLELMANKVSEADEQRNKLLAVMQEKQNAILLLQVKENELQKQMKVAVDLVLGLSSALSDFECRVAEGFKKNNLRLEESTHQLISLIQKTSTLKRTKLLYKQKLERRCADLQMAEAEVMIYL